MLAGLGAGMMEAIIAVTPSETIKTKMIEDSKRVDGPRFKGLVHGVKMIVKEEGYRGVYRGVGPVVSCSSLHPLLLGCLLSITRRSRLRILFSIRWTSDARTVEATAKHGLSIRSRQGRTSLTADAATRRQFCCPILLILHPQAACPRKRRRRIPITRLDDVWYRLSSGYHYCLYVSRPVPAL